MLQILTIVAAIASAQGATLTLPSTDIQRDVEAAVTQRLREASSTARVLGVVGVRDQSLPAGRVTLDVGAIAGRWPRARAGVPVRLSVDGRAVRTVIAWVELGDVRNVLTYAAPAPAKAPLDALRLVAGDVDMLCCDGATAQSADKLEGMRVRRAVRTGEPVLLSDFEPMPEVAERQQVGIEVVRGPVRLTTVGTALADGRIGQVIAVRPDASEHTVKARVTAKHTVTLDEQVLEESPIDE
jgi:flagellar basal body P-ring formation protein FlgA